MTMDLGISDRVRPLRDAVRQMVREEIMPLDVEYHHEVGKAKGGRQRQIQAIWRCWSVTVQKNIKSVG